MTIFNETFTAGKPIYYPSNWETGKTADQLYSQWKLTMQYYIISNCLQCIISALWLLFVLVICNGLKQIWRLYNLDDMCRQKIENRRYIDSSFIFGVAFVSVIAFGVTFTLIVLNQFTRYALIKGFVFFVVVYLLRKLYMTLKPQIQASRKTKKQYEKLKKDEIQQ